jgi:cob(I)alamin adenosyltransferase
MSEEEGKASAAHETAQDTAQKAEQEPDQEKGLLMVYTGKGKGKTSAALGTVFRALGYGWKAGVVQFIKGKWKTGERVFADTLPGVDFHVMGEGFTWESDDLSRDKRAAEAAWARGKAMIESGEYPLVVLDEITYAIHFGFISEEDVLRGLQNRPRGVNVIVTGRNAPESILEAADLVTEMTNVKHPYQKGIKAKVGIDF